MDEKIGNKNKKRKTWKTVVLYIFVALLFVSSAGFGAAAAVYKNYTNRINVVKTDTLEEADVKDQELAYDQDVINLLLIGADKREKEEGLGRSDSIMIGTIDVKNKKLKLTTLMRDMYIDIPGHDTNKLNAAYAFGGPKLTYEAIANTFDVKLDGYVIVDMHAFRNVVDILGGVEMNLTKEEATYLQTAYKTSSHGEVDVVEGENLLTSYQALAYSRIRQDITGDFGRTDRQRKVIMALYDKVMDLDLISLNKLVYSCLPDVTTDLDKAHIQSLITTVVGMGKVEIEQHRIPLEYTYETGRVTEKGNMWVIFPDYDVNKAALQYFLFGIGEEPAGTESFNQGNEHFITYEAPEKLEGSSTY